jgi:hypothetical protein
MIELSSQEIINGLRCIIWAMQEGPAMKSTIVTRAHKYSRQHGFELTRRRIEIIMENQTGLWPLGHNQIGLRHAN